MHNNYINLDCPNKLIGHEVEILQEIEEHCQSKVKTCLSCYGDACKGMQHKQKTIDTFLPPLSIFYLPKAYICPKGGIYSPDTLKPFISRRQFPGELTNLITNNLEKEYIIDPPFNKYSNVYYSALFRPGDHIYGHWLVDILPKVWLTETANLDKSVIYLVKDIPTWARSFLRKVGVDDDRIIDIKTNKDVFHLTNIILTPNLRYDQLIHPLLREFSLFLQNHFVQPNPSSMIYKALLEHSNRIFISRDSWKKASCRTLLNREDVERVFENRGFLIFKPELFSVEDQATIFHNAKLIAGEDGSGMHNSIFGNKKQTYINIRSDKNHSLIQGSLCTALNQDIIYLFGSTQGEHSNRQSPYTLNLHKLNDAISYLPP